MITYGLAPNALIGPDMLASAARGQLPSADVFVESLRRLPAADAAANTMWGSDVLLRGALPRGRKPKEPKWERRWLWVFPQLPVQTLEGWAQAILVYKGANVSNHLHPLCILQCHAHSVPLRANFHPAAAAAAQALTPWQVHPVYSSVCEAHRSFESAARPPRFRFEIDSRGSVATLRWQLTFAVETAEAAEGWSQYWSEVSDGLSGASTRHRAQRSIEQRLANAEPVRLEGTLGLRLAKARKYMPRWCVIRGPLMQFYTSEAEARQTEAEGRILTRHAATHGGKGADAQEATVHLEHAIVSTVAGKPGAIWCEFEIISGGKSWTLQAATEAEATTWTKTLQSLAVVGDSNGSSREGPAVTLGAGVGPTPAHSAAIVAGTEHDVVTVRGEVGQQQLGVSFARCHSASLGTEYFTVQRIRGPDTVGSAAEPQLKLGMILQSINGVPLMLMLAECGGRGDLVLQSMQRQLAERPLTLTFVRSPAMLRPDIDAAKATLASAPTKPAAVVVAPVRDVHGGDERRLVSGSTSYAVAAAAAAATLGHGSARLEMEMSAGEVGAARAGTQHVTFAANGSHDNGRPSADVRGVGVSAAVGITAAGNWKRSGARVYERTGGGGSSGYSDAHSGGAGNGSPRRMSMMSMGSAGGSSIGGMSAVATSVQSGSFLSSSSSAAYAAAADNRSAGGSQMSSGSAADASKHSESPIRLARGHYGPWWSSMTRREQQIAVAAAEQEQALVAMGVMEPHEFEFHPGGEEEPFAMEAADEAARAARRAELAPPTAGYDHYGDGSAKSSGSVVGGTASTNSSAGASLDRAAARPLASVSLADLAPDLAEMRIYAGEATREYLQGVADARRMSISSTATSLRGVPLAGSEATAGVPFGEGGAQAGGHAEFWQGVHDARAQANELALRSPGSPAERWAASPAGAAPAGAAPTAGTAFSPAAQHTALGSSFRHAPQQQLRQTSVEHTAAALALTPSGEEYDL